MVKCSYSVVSGEYIGFRTVTTLFRLRRIGKFLAGLEIEEMCGLCCATLNAARGQFISKLPKATTLDQRFALSLYAR
jgi:hypothetical protein